MQWVWFRNIVYNIIHACMLNQCLQDKKLTQTFQTLFLACLTYKLYPLKLWSVFNLHIKRGEAFIVIGRYVYYVTAHARTSFF